MDCCPRNSCGYYCGVPWSHAVEKWLKSRTVRKFAEANVAVISISTAASARTCPSVLIWKRFVGCLNMSKRSDWISTTCEAVSPKPIFAFHDNLACHNSSRPFARTFAAQISIGTMFGCESLFSFVSGIPVCMRCAMLCQPASGLPGPTNNI